MSQEICKQKRRWLKRILNARASTALWLAPALSMAVLPSDSGYSQVPAAQTPAAQPSAAAQANPTVDVAFVMGWLEQAAKQAEAGDLKSSAKSFAEALRARQLLKDKSDKLETRLKQVETLVVSKGMTKANIVDAIGSLGAMAPAGKSQPVVLAGGASLPAMPGQAGAASAAVAPVISAGTQPAAPAGLPAVRSASAQGEIDVPTPLNNNASGDELYRRGVEQLAQGQREAAVQSFRQAWQYEREMDPALRNQLKDKLSLLSSAPSASATTAGAPARQVNEEELAMRQKMMSEVTGEIAAAEANREAEPQVVAERLQTLRTRVSQANLEGNARKQMLTIVDRAIASHQIYMTQNSAAIDQNMRNRQITEQLSLDQEERQKIDQQIASLVETYNDGQA